MKAARLMQHKRLLATTLVVGMATYGGAALAAGESTTAPATPGASMGTTPMAPSKSETADSAFKKLDAGSKGYVTHEDTKALPGFEAMFDKFNTKHDGKLTRDEFARAWTSYVTTNVSSK